MRSALRRRWPKGCPGGCEPAAAPLHRGADVPRLIQRFSSVSADPCGVVAMPQFEHFKTRQEGGVAVLQLLDPRLFDTLMVSELQDELVAYLEKEKPAKVLVDFDSVTHCSTAVINGLLRAKKRLMEWGGELKFCNMDDTIREAYRLLNLDGTVFHIYDSKSDAMSDF
jgi:anti-anti-sigma regulatory factor